MIKPLLPLLLLLPGCVSAGDAAWSGLHASAFGGMMAASTDGAVNNVKATSHGADLKGDVDLGSDTDNVFHFGARAGVSPFELVYSDLSLRTANPSVFAAGGTFAGNVLAADLRSTTTVDMAVRKLLLGLDVFSTGVLRLALLLGVDEVSFDEISLTADRNALGGLVQKGDKQVVLRDETVYVPMVGARADLDLPEGFRLGAELSGISASTGDADVSYFDFAGAVHYAFTANIEALLGYRYITIDVDGTFSGSRFDSSLDLTGPFLAVGVVF
ncbi:MAG: hypothetical protein D6702_04865 [Planctomycetota bacterium]|nr:MAG: hypothetical protein D6702_04865 [Planctomycetota bacterium]